VVAARPAAATSAEASLLRLLLFLDDVYDLVGDAEVFDLLPPSTVSS